jgi:hypothetical protein
MEGRGGGTSDEWNQVCVEWNFPEWWRLAAFCFHVRILLAMCMLTVSFQIHFFFNLEIIQRLPSLHLKLRGSRGVTCANQAQAIDSFRAINLLAPSSVSLSS